MSCLLSARHFISRSSASCRACYSPRLEQDAGSKTRIIIHVATASLASIDMWSAWQNSVVWMVIGYGAAVPPSVRYLIPLIPDQSKLLPEGNPLPPVARRVAPTIATNTIKPATKKFGVPSETGRYCTRVLVTCNMPSEGPSFLGRHFRSSVSNEIEVVNNV